MLSETAKLDEIEEKKLILHMDHKALPDKRKHKLYQKLPKSNSNKFITWINQANVCYILAVCCQGFTQEKQVVRNNKTWIKTQLFLWINEPKFFMSSITCSCCDFPKKDKRICETAKFAPTQTKIWENNKNA